MENVGGGQIVEKVNNVLQYYCIRLEHRYNKTVKSIRGHSLHIYMSIYL